MTTNIDCPHQPTADETVELWCAHLAGDTVIPTVNHNEARKIADAETRVLTEIRDRDAREGKDPKHGVQPSGHPCR